LQLPARRYAIFAHRGHVSTLQQTIAAIFSQWLPQSGQRVTPPAAGALGFIERYGEGFNPQSGRGDIEVWLPLAG